MLKSSTGRLLFLDEPLQKQVKPEDQTGLALHGAGDQQKNESDVDGRRIIYFHH